jgi:hypothetical protein
LYLSTSEIAGFDVLPAGDKCQIILALVRAYVAIDIVELARLRPPPVYECAVRYGFQPSVDKWLDVQRALETGEASCNSLAAWRVAELLLDGEQATPYIRTQTQHKPEGGLLDVFHVIVRRPLPAPYDWEDPSLTLGMPAGG